MRLLKLSIDNRRWSIFALAETLMKPEQENLFKVKVI